jgi:large subunit ribosomal protein L10
MRPEKIAILEEYSNSLDSADYVIMANCTGMTMEQFDELRAKLRENNGKLQIVKNKIYAKAVTDQGKSFIDSSLIGPTAVISGEGDVTVVAKAIKNYVKSAGLPVVKGGILGDKALSIVDVKALADMPSREIMLGMFVGTVAAPMTQLVGVVNQKLLTLLYVLKAVADKKNGE